jgi:hypothetical protein
MTRRPTSVSTGQWEAGILAGLLLASGRLGLCQDSAREIAEPSLTITVWIYNHAEVPGSTLAKAQHVAGRIFRETGTEVKWLHCQRSAAEPPAHHGCNKPFGFADIALRIVPRSMAAHLDPRRESLGFAIPSVGSGHGADAWVFYHRVEELAQSGLAPRYVVLGHAMAHEIGHLLLGANRHYPQGIMSPDWSPEDLKLATWGMLLFTREQAERIRAEVLARVKAQAAAETPEVASRESQDTDTR